jgi:hypothetical protein
MTNVLWRKYRDFSGCLVRGVGEVTPQDPSLHLSCAAWLTSKAEGPTYGFVQSYDGAGISAGLLHNILVFPKDLSQGDLGHLVRRMLTEACPDREGRLRELMPPTWNLSSDGRFRIGDRLVSGSALRAWAAPPNGRVPQSGSAWESAKEIALFFHELFADPRTYAIQERFAIEWLGRGQRANELSVYQRLVDSRLSKFDDLRVSQMPGPVHVAMSVYHSFSVNSPATALKCLRAVPASVTDPTLFAKRLIRELGTHGRDVWHDEPGTGNNRYDRTRVALWSRSDMFPGGTELMPRDL